MSVKEADCVLGAQPPCWCLATSVADNEISSEPSRGTNQFRSCYRRDVVKGSFLFSGSPGVDSMNTVASRGAPWGTKVPNLVKSDLAGYANTSK